MLNETQTLISLAWMLAHPGATLAPQIDLAHANMTDAERQQLQILVNPNERLPAEMEQLLRRTEFRIQIGELKEESEHAPSDSCA